MTRPGSPEALADLRDAIVRWLDEDITSYGHVYGAAYEGRKGGQRRAAAICTACDGTGWVGQSRCELCTPAVSDPTGDVVVNMAGVRDQLGEVTERVTKMWQLAKGNRKVLRAAEVVLDRGADTETTGAALRRAERRSAAEIGEARAAQQRRKVRGEQLPGTLPRGAT